jgi:hypothetical protein
MAVDMGIQIIQLKLVNQRCPVLVDIAVTNLPTNDRAIIGLDQGVVIGLPGA